MRKKLLLFVCAFATMLTLRAQTTPFEEQAMELLAFGIGIKGGIGLSVPDVGEWNNQTVTNLGVHERVGMHLGAVGMWPLSTSLAFRPELNYASQGFKETGSSTSAPFGGRTVKHHYLQVPLMMQLALSNYVCFYTGPKFGYMVQSSEGFKRGDLAWDLGLSAINSWHLGFDVRYSSGIVNIAPKRHPAIARMKNKVLQVGVIYLFTVKK
jgi:hypothetical protein